MKQRDFKVTGFEPDKQKTSFLHAFDVLPKSSTIGEQRSFTVTAKLDDGVTPEQMERQIPAMRMAFEAQGWSNVKVMAGEVYETNT